MKGPLLVPRDFRPGERKWVNTIRFLRGPGGEEGFLWPLVYLQ